MTELRDPLPIHSPGGTGTASYRDEQQPGVIPLPAGGANRIDAEPRSPASTHLAEHARLGGINHEEQK